MRSPRGIHLLSLNASFSVLMQDEAILGYNGGRPQDGRARGGKVRRTERCHMSHQAKGRRMRSRFGGLLVASVLLAVAVVGTWIYAQRVSRQAQSDSTSEYERSAMFLAGLDRPVNNRLDARFADADQNLVADPAPAGVSPDPLVFSYIAVEDAEEYAAAWQPFVDHLAKVTGRAVKYDASLTDVPSQVRALQDGKLHVTGLNSGSVSLAVNACGFVPVAVLPGDDGSGMTRMRIIVPASSPFTTPGDLRGAAMTMTDLSSNSGYKAVVVLLRSEFGLLPGRDYETRFSGSHAASIAGVRAKSVAAAAVADDMLARATAAGEISPGDYRTLYESERFPAAALGYANNLEAALAAKVTEAIRTFDWKGTTLERPLGAAHTKFAPADYKDQWSLIRRIDDETGTKHAVSRAAAPSN
jgi:phosphonate transport system substrate-binding protein